MFSSSDAEHLKHKGQEKITLQILPLGYKVETVAIINSMQRPNADIYVGKAAQFKFKCHSLSIERLFLEYHFPLENLLLYVFGQKSAYNLRITKTEFGMSRISIRDLHTSFFFPMFSPICLSS